MYGLPWLESDGIDSLNLGSSFQSRREEQLKEMHERKNFRNKGASNEDQNSSDGRDDQRKPKGSRWLEDKLVCAAPGGKRDPSDKTAERLEEALTETIRT